MAELFHEDQISARGQCDDIDPIGAVDDVKIVLRPGAWRLLAVGANGEAAKIGEGTGGNLGPGFDRRSVFEKRAGRFGLRPGARRETALRNVKRAASDRVMEA
jgi:hypothetical protein